MEKKTVALVAERFPDKAGDFILKQIIHLMKIRKDSRVVVLHNKEITENNKELIEKFNILEKTDWSVKVQIKEGE